MSISAMERLELYPCQLAGVTSPEKLPFRPSVGLRIRIIRMGHSERPCRVVSVYSQILIPGSIYQQHVSEESVSRVSLVHTENKTGRFITPIFLMLVVLMIF